MNLPRARRARQIFQEIVERPEADRAALLDAACGDDLALRAEVEALLAADQRAGGFLAAPSTAGSAALPSADDDDMIGRTIGGYTIRRRIGVGGMGVVYEAEQASPRRTVALKLMRTALASAERAGRFVLEADVLARLQHPGVAQVFDGGVHHEAGVALPYFAMEYVAGARPITTCAAERNLDRDARLALFAEVCDAVEHGHQRGVIHRDLKPANILVDQAGQPRVIDFGVARLVAPETDRTAMHTETGQIVGTLHYMSPEQCDGRMREIDTRTDVYSLGVVLYELLCGALPYDLDGTLPFEVPAIIRTAVPIRLSHHDRNLRGDLETIVHKALEKDRDRRYNAVGDLARDIRRHLANEPIEARAASSIYLLRKSLARHRSAVLVAAGVSLLMLVASVGLGLLYSRAETQRRIASERADSLRWAKYVGDIALAQAAFDKRDGNRMHRHLDACPPDLRDWEWDYLARLSDMSRAVTQLADHSLGAAYSPHGRRIVTWGQDGRVRLLNAADLTLTCEFQAGTEPLHAAAFAPDGRRLATAGYDRTVRLWNADDGRLIHSSLADGERVTSAVFTPDGRLLVSGGWDATVKLWQVADGTPRGELAGGGLALACSTDGTRLYGISADGLLSVWDLATRQRIAAVRVQQRQPAAFALSPDGRLLSIGAHDVNAIRVLRTDTLEVVARFECAARAASAAFSPDSRRLAVASLSIEIFDLETGTAETARLGHDLTTSIAFAPDGVSLLSAGRNGDLRLWDAAPLREPVVLSGHGDMVRSVVAYPDGRRLATAARDGTIRVWDADRGALLRRWDAHPQADQVLAIDADGRWLASGGADGVIRIWDAERGGLHRELAGHEALVVALAFSPTADRLASVGFDHTARVWNLDDGSQQYAISAASNTFSDVRFTSDGGALLLSTADGTIEFRAAEDGTVRRALRGGGDRILRIACSPDGTRVAATCGSGLVRVWNATDGRLLHELRGHTSAAQSLAFLPAANRLVTGGYDGVIHVWDVTRGDLVLTLTGHEGGIPGLAVAPAGGWLATASNDRTIRVWRSESPPEDANP